MIQMQTVLDVADNTGARSVMCIKVLGGSKRRYASVGDVIKVSIRDAAPRGRVRQRAWEHGYSRGACATRSFSFLRTKGATNLETSPPSMAISRTNVPLMYWY